MDSVWVFLSHVDRQASQVQSDITTNDSLLNTMSLSHVASYLFHYSIDHPSQGYRFAISLTALNDK